MHTRINSIHRASMEILEKTGVRFHHPEVIEMVQAHGFHVEGDKAFFSEDRLMKLVGKAPDNFTLHASNQRHDAFIGGENMELAAGYGAPAVVDPDGGARPATFQDYAGFARLVQASDTFNLNGGTLVQPGDLLPGQAMPLMVYATLHHSDKGLIAPNGSPDETRILFRMLDLFFGADDMARRPRVITIANTLSPLQFDRHVLVTILEYCQRRQPVIVTPAVMAGATGPVTVAGSLALANAEALAGIALTQMIAEGTPVVYGMQSTAADMRTGGFSIGGPERAFFISWGARLARAYNLPYRASGTDNDACMVDAQAGMEAMFTMFVTWQARPNLVIHAAGMLCGHGAMSYEKFMLDLEMLSMLKHYEQGIAVDENALALAAVHDVGVGGQFLTHRHTFDNCRKSLWTPKASYRGQLKARGGQHDFIAHLKDQKERLMAGYKKPELDVGRLEAVKKMLADEGLKTDYDCLG